MRRVHVTTYTQPLVGAQQVTFRVKFPPGTEYQGLVVAPTLADTGPIQADARIGFGSLSAIVANGTVMDSGVGASQEDIHWLGTLGPFDLWSEVIVNLIGVTGQTAGVNVYVYFIPPEGD